MPRAPGLRSQLLLGLTVVFLVASLSAGGVTYWAARGQQLDERVAQSRLMADGIAHVVATALDSAQPQRLARVLGELSAGPLLGPLFVVDLDGRVVAGTSPNPSALQQARRAVTSGLQQVMAVDDPSPRLNVATPLRVEGRRRGAVYLETPLGVGERWPKLFWLMVGFDAIIIVGFMAMALTRYVVGPLRAMQRAALRMADGDLSARIQTSDTMELTSLADSFNRMAASVQDQLGRLERQQCELHASREHLIRSEKLASVGRLAAGVAHEVGNPLQSIIGFTDMILGDGLSPEQSRDFLERTRGEAQRIHHIIRELLDFARPVEDAIEPISLDAIVDLSLQLVGPQKRRKEVKVERVGLEGLPRVAASGPRLVQVLVNILLNAADATPKDGTISIEGHADDGSGRVELRIANTGPLIPPEHRGQIFDPFFTTKEPGQGTGLGLSVAQSILEFYGGQVLLLDEPRTTFALLLKPWHEKQEA